jgi:hypothetical protein
MYEALTIFNVFVVCTLCVKTGVDVHVPGANIFTNNFHRFSCTRLLKYFKAFLQPRGSSKQLFYIHMGNTVSFSKAF